jgi:hypothetical protein
MFWFPVRLFNLPWVSQYSAYLRLQHLLEGFIAFGARSQPVAATGHDTLMSQGTFLEKVQHGDQLVWVKAHHLRACRFNPFESVDGQICPSGLVICQR